MKPNFMRVLLASLLVASAILVASASAAPRFHHRHTGHVARPYRAHPASASWTWRKVGATNFRKIK